VGCVVYIYYGNGGGLCPGGIDENSPVNVSPDVTITGDSDKGEFGYTLAILGDVNGDDISDFIVGAPFADSNRGNAFIFYGSSILPSQMVASDAGITIVGDSTGDQFGFSVNGGGDLDGNGIGDLVIGADKAGNAGEGGSAYVFFGEFLPILVGNGTASDSDVEFSGIVATDQLGWSVAITGDLSGDNNSDIVVGTPFPNSEQGRVYVFYSDNLISKSASLADATLSGVSPNNRFGWSVADAGDLNLDGFSDLIVGAPQSPLVNPNNGIVYVFYGGPSLMGNINAGDSNNPDILSFQGEGSLDQFGNSISGIGDTNGDGYDEFIVGAPFNDNNSFIDNGAAYIYR